MRSILMACEGNICRSPMAEGYFAHQLANNPSINVSSCGINAVVDYPAEKNAKLVMDKYGIDISSHRARLFTEEMIRDASLILVMTKAQLKFFTQQFLMARGKTFLLGHWQNIEIVDPIMQPISIFERIYHEIERAWQTWKGKIECQS